VRVAARLAARWRVKLALLASLPVAFCVPYFALQRFTVAPVRTFSPSWLDRQIAFDPAWTLVYQSLYLLMPLVPWLATTDGELHRYTRGFLALSVACFVVFLVFPVSGPRPDQAPAHAPYRLLVAYDAPLNSFPSLHAALAAYTLLFARRVLAWPASLAALGIGWVCAIGYATLATKQHFAVDLPPAVLLAVAADRWAFTLAPERRP
jgi:membrane-associated phospholipid phosphatase